jgi:hypothetical protein
VHLFRQQHNCSSRRTICSQEAAGPPRTPRLQEDVQRLQSPVLSRLQFLRWREGAECIDHVLSERFCKRPGCRLHLHWRDSGAPRMGCATAIHRGMERGMSPSDKYVEARLTEYSARANDEVTYPWQVKATSNSKMQSILKSVSFMRHRHKTRYPVDQRTLKTCTDSICIHLA